MKTNTYFFWIILLIINSLYSQNKENYNYEVLYKQTYESINNGDFFNASMTIDSTLINLENQKLEKYEAKFLILKGSLYENFHEYKKSQKYYEKAMHIFESIDDSIMNLWTHSVLAHSYMLAKNYTKLNNNLAELKNKVGNDNILIFYLLETEISALYNQKKHSDNIQLINKAIIELNNSILKLESKDFKRYNTFFRLIKSFSLMNLQQYNKANVSLNFAKSIDFNKFDWLIEYKPSIYRYKHEYFFMNKKMDSAKFYHKKFIKATNELHLFKDNKIKKDKILIQNILKGEKELIKSNLKLKIQKEKVKKKNILIVTLITITFSLIYILLLYRNSKKLKSKNTTIDLLNNSLKSNIVKLKKTNIENEKLIKLNELNIFSKTTQISAIRDNAQKIKNDLNKLTNKNEEIKSYHLFKIENSVESLISDNEIWNDFKTQFEILKPDFFTYLKNTNVKLTITELKHCAYVSSGLKVKEVAKLINLSPRSVETTRYRIKKKLNISKDVKLYDFLIGYAEQT